MASTLQNQSAVSDTTSVLQTFIEQRQKARLYTVLGAAIFCAAVWGASYQLEVSASALWNGLPSIGEYVMETIPPITLGELSSGIHAWYWNFPTWVSLLFDTFLIALAATSLAALLAIFICFPATARLKPSPMAYQFARRFIDFTRAVPTIIFALLFVYAFGVGPLPGVLAIILHTMGVLAKLFADTNENVDLRPLEGITACGGSRSQVIVFGVLPQVLPTFASFILLRFEVNIRAASILGFVGAGGIGQELMFAIRQFQFTDMSAIVVMIIATVVLIDAGTQYVRRQLLGKHGDAK